MILLILMLNYILINGAVEGAFVLFVLLLIFRWHDAMFDHGFLPFFFAALRG